MAREKQLQSADLGVRDDGPSPSLGVPGKLPTTARVSGRSRIYLIVGGADHRATSPQPVQRAADRDSPAWLDGPLLAHDLSSPVQLALDAHTGLGDAQVAAIAAGGVAGPARQLPHLDAIQRAFGPHDVGGVEAHVGAAARDASTALGAHAYATGNHVAFAAEPGLFLAAHEAAHVVQQRAGVSLASAVGHAGDGYEQHADAVAARVVAGASAADLLGPVGGAHRPGPVQREEGEGNLFDQVMAAQPPEARFPFVDRAEQRRILLATPVNQRAALLDRIPPAAARFLLLDPELPRVHQLTVLVQLPSIVAGLTVEQALPLFEVVMSPPRAQHQIFNKLPISMRANLLPVLASRIQAEVYPVYNGASPAEHATLLAGLPDSEIEAILAFREEHAVQVLVETVPRHVGARLVRLAASIHPSVTLPDETEQERTAVEAEAEGGAGVARRPRRGGRVPSAEEWAALPRDERVELFRAAAVATRARLLGVEPEGKRRMIREVRGAELLETLAAFVSKPGGKSLLRDMSPPELLESALRDPDPAAVALLIPHLTAGQRREVIPALTPSHLAGYLADRGNDRDEAWAMVRSAAPPESLTAALRRLSDEQLSDLHFQLSPANAASVLELVPESRRGLLATP